MLVYYFGLKVAFLMGLVRSFTRFDVLGRHALALAGLYTGGVALLSWVFLLAPRPGPIDWRAWQIWLAVTFALALAYLKLLGRFDEGAAFWAVLLLGFLIVLY